MRLGLLHCLKMTDKRDIQDSRIIVQNIVNDIKPGTFVVILKIGI